jgi:hypothetical protein
MDADRSRAVATLLREAEAAHATYEADELGSVYDEAWPRWYATYAVEHGLSRILDHDAGVDELTALLAESYADFASADPQPPEPWADYTAARIAAEL